ncbi:MAG: TMEM14 family protein [Verrucomicrobiia bacterium]
MISFAKSFFLAFGLLVLLGGILGYINAKSLPSLIAGGVSGLVLIALAIRLGAGQSITLWMLIIVSLLLAGRFLQPWIKSGFQLPDSTLPLLSLLGSWILILVGPLGVVGAGVALAALFLKR